MSGIFPTHFQANHSTQDQNTPPREVPAVSLKRKAESRSPSPVAKRRAIDVPFARLDQRPSLKRKADEELPPPAAKRQAGENPIAAKQDILRQIYDLQREMDHLMAQTRFSFVPQSPAQQQRAASSSNRSASDIQMELTQLQTMFAQLG